MRDGFFQFSSFERKAVGAASWMAVCPLSAVHRLSYASFLFQQFWIVISLHPEGNLNQIFSGACFWWGNICISGKWLQHFGCHSKLVPNACDHHSSTIFSPVFVKLVCIVDYTKILIKSENGPRLMIFAKVHGPISFLMAILIGSHRLTMGNCLWLA